MPNERELRDCDSQTKPPRQCIFNAYREGSNNTPRQNKIHIIYESNRVARHARNTGKCWYTTFILLNIVDMLNHIQCHRITGSQQICCAGYWLMFAAGMTHRDKSIFLQLPTHNFCCCRVVWNWGEKFTRYGIFLLYWCCSWPDYRWRNRGSWGCGTQDWWCTHRAGCVGFAHALA